MKKRFERLFAENVLLKLVSLAAAVLLWLVILNVDDPINTKTINGVSVTVLNESLITNSGMIYQIENGSNSISVTVTARRSILSKIHTENIEAIADMSNLTLDSLVPIEVRINGYEGRYESATANPNNLQISIEKNGTVRLPISVSTSGLLADGYFVESTTVSPSTLVISGPETQIATIASVVLRVDISNLSATETLTGTLTYYDKDGIALDNSVLSSSVAEEDIYATVKILPVKQVPIEVLADGIPAEGYELTEITCEPQTASVVGKTDALAAIEKITIDPEDLNLEGADTSLEVVCDLTEYLPEGISLADGFSEKVMVTARIEKAGTATIVYPVASIAAINVPERYKVNYEQTTELEMEFTGSLQDLEKLRADDLKVTIDLADYQKEGRVEVPVQVEAPSGCTLTKPVTVVVNLTKE